MVRCPTLPRNEPFRRFRLPIWIGAPKAKMHLTSKNKNAASPDSGGDALYFYTSSIYLASMQDARVNIQGCVSLDGFPSLATRRSLLAPAVPVCRVPALMAEYLAASSNCKS